jgi:hypothetical protein
LVTDCLIRFQTWCILGDSCGLSYLGDCNDWNVGACLNSESGAVWLEQTHIMSPRSCTYKTHICLFYLFVSHCISRRPL